MSILSGMKVDTKAFILNHIARLPRNTIFTTREVLRYGTRNAVDQAMFQLVRDKLVLRLARGVFVRVRGMTKTFSVKEIAEAKAKAFGKSIFMHGADAARRIGLTKQGNEGFVYLVDGSTSSFRVGDVVVHFKRCARRMIVLKDTGAGLAVRAMWNVGERITQAQIGLVKRTLDRENFDRFVAGFGLMPAWLTDKLDWHLRGFPFVWRYQYDPDVNTAPFGGYPFVSAEVAEYRARAAAPAELPLPGYTAA